MAQPSSTEQPEVNVDLILAEAAVHRNANRLESAIEKLAEKVQDSSTRVQQTVHSVNETRESLIRMKDKVIETKDRVISEVVARVQPARPYVERALRTSNIVVTHARRNPQPYLFVAAGLIASALLLRFVQNNRQDRLFRLREQEWQGHQENLKYDHSIY